jgi:hypothetical protein
MSAEPQPSRLVFPLRPIPVKAGLRRPVTLPQYLPARMLNEFVYCPRLFFYEWVEGVFAHSDDTVEGALRHETLGEKPEAMPAAQDAGEERIHSRSVSLSSDTHGLTAVIDLVEGDGRRVSPVDYNAVLRASGKGRSTHGRPTSSRCACRRSSFAITATRATRRSSTTTRRNSAYGCR